jgi:hypothetical protein
MEKIIGGVLGLAAVAAVVVAGAIRGMPVLDVLVRAAVAGLLGFLVGWALFGKVGTELAKESAGQPVAPAPSVPKAPASPAPPAPPTTPAAK